MSNVACYMRCNRRILTTIRAGLCASLGFGRMCAFWGSKSMQRVLLLMTAITMACALNVTSAEACKVNTIACGSQLIRGPAATTCDASSEPQDAECQPQHRAAAAVAGTETFSGLRGAAFTRRDTQVNACSCGQMICFDQCADVIARYPTSASLTWHGIFSTEHIHGRVCLS